MAQQVQVELIGKDRASKEIQGVANTLEKMKISVEGNRAGLGKLDNALKDSAANMLGLQGGAGRLADAFLEFAPGGLIGAGVVAGFAAIYTAMKNQEKAQERLTKAIDDSQRAFVNQFMAIGALQYGEASNLIVNLQEEYRKLKKDIDDNTESISRNDAVLTEIITRRQKLREARPNVGPESDVGAGVLPSFRAFADFMDKFTARDTNAQARQVELENKRQDLNADRIRLQTTSIQQQYEAIVNNRKQLVDDQELLGYSRARAAELQTLTNRLRDFTDGTANLFNVETERYENLRVSTSLQRAAERELGTIRRDAARTAEERAKKLKEEEEKRAKALEDEIAANEKRNEEYRRSYEEEEKRKTEILRKNIEERNRLEEEKRLRDEAGARYIDFLTKQILVSDRKATEEQIAFIKKRIEEEQVKLAFFAMRGMTDAMIETQQKIEDLQTAFTEKLQSGFKLTAFQIGVNALADSFSAMGAAIASGQNALVAFGKAAKQAIGQSLQILGREQLVKGLSNLASGFAAAALGPIGGKSSKDFFKAAGFNFTAAALAGAAGGAMGGGAAGGGGVAGGGFSNSQLGRNNFTTQQPLTIIVQGGSLLDMSNPDTVRSFTSALETVSSRRITINRVGA